MCVNFKKFLSQSKLICKSKLQKQNYDTKNNQYGTGITHLVQKAVLSLDCALSQPTTHYEISLILKHVRANWITYIQNFYEDPMQSKETASFPSAH